MRQYDLSKINKNDNKGRHKQKGLLQGKPSISKRTTRALRDEVSRNDEAKSKKQVPSRTRSSRIKASVSKKDNKLLPVTLLSGFLGSGKTTLLKHILTNKVNLKVAVIVNDMASLNIDAALVEKASILHQNEEMIQLQNGCICCTLRGDLLKSIHSLAYKEFDYLIIESTGISEPMQVAETFAAPADAFEGVSDLKSLLSVARLDTCVTVVDACSFFEFMECSNFFDEQFVDEGTSAKTVAHLLVEQCEFADVIILNKTDLVTVKILEKLKCFLATLNPTALIVTSTYSKIPLDKVLNTNRFNMERASTSAGWMASLTEGHTPETDEYGISSFVYTRDIPFHPERLHQLVNKYFMLLEGDGEEDGEEDNSDKESNDKDSDDEEQFDDEKERKKRIENRKNAITDFKDLLRSKGFFWLASRPTSLGEWSQAGVVLTVNYSEEWDPLAGSEMTQSIVFIGSFSSTSKTSLEEKLDACLLNRRELMSFKKGNYSKFEDPWAEWPTEEDDILA